ncbi:MAG TPA: response regulator, partial [Candidatus Acidoferrales bacterium]
MTRKLAPISPSGATILLVDDDPGYLEATRRLLEREGHQVLCAADGPAALATLRERPVDVLLLDYFMPGMTGEEVVAQLRLFNVHVQIILQTGYASEHPPREMLRRLDIQGYFDKSEGPDKLLLWTEAGLKAARNIQQLNHLHEALKTQRVEEQAILLCLSQALLKETEAQAVMELSVRMTAEALRAPVVGLRLPDRLPDPTCLILRASVGVPSAQAGALRLPLGQGSASGYAFSRGEPLVIEDFEAETRFQVYSLRRQLGVSAGLVAPMIA